MTTYTTFFNLHPLLASEVKAYRNALGLTQSDFAHHLGLTTSTIARWEQSKKPIKPAGMIRLALKRLCDLEGIEPPKIKEENSSNE